MARPARSPSKKSKSSLGAIDSADYGSFRAPPLPFPDDDDASASAEGGEAGESGNGSGIHSPPKYSADQLREAKAKAAIYADWLGRVSVECQELGGPPIPDDVIVILKNMATHVALVYGDWDVVGLSDRGQAMVVAGGGLVAIAMRHFLRKRLKESQGSPKSPNNGAARGETSTPARTVGGFDRAF